MTTLAAGASTSVTLTQGSTLKTSGAGLATFGAGPQQNMTMGLLGSVTIGPFPADQVVNLCATQTQIDYVLNVTRGNGIIVSSSAPVNADGTPDGTIYIQTP